MKNQGKHQAQFKTVKQQLKKTKHQRDIGKIKEYYTHMRASYKSTVQLRSHSHSSHYKDICRDTQESFNHYGGKDNGWKKNSFPKCFSIYQESMNTLK